MYLCNNGSTVVRSSCASLLSCFVHSPKQLAAVNFDWLETQCMG